MSLVDTQPPCKLPPLPMPAASRTVFAAAGSRSDLSPAAQLPAARHVPIGYDVAAVRRRLGVRGVGICPLSHVEAFDALWVPAELARDVGTAHDPYVDADMNLDATSVEWAVSWPHRGSFVLDGMPERMGEQVRRSRMRAIMAAHASAYALGRAHLADGGFPHLPGHLTPDPSIDCVVERALVFAAGAIAGGVDDVLARAWASAIIVAHGLERPSWEIDPVMYASTFDSFLWSRETHQSVFYAQAIDDLRERGDATRFMTSTSRAIRP